MKRLVLPRVLMVWYRDCARERLEATWRDMQTATTEGNATLRAFVDQLVAEIEMWNRLALDEGRHAYLIGEEEVERDASGVYRRVGPLTFSRAPEPRFGLLVRGPFCWLGTGGVRCAAPDTPVQPAGGLYVPVTRKVSLKNETATLGTPSR